jgi:IS1 family transposase
MAGCSINTVPKLLMDAGATCAAYQDEHLRDLPCKTVEADEIWSFVYAKQKNVPDEFKGQFGIGDVWTWTALCADTKLIASWYVGGRDRDDAQAFLADLKERLRGRIQLTTDEHRPTKRLLASSSAKTSIGRSSSRTTPLPGRARLSTA